MRQFKVEEIVHLGKLVATQIAKTNFILAYDFVADPLPKAEVNWAYGLKDYE